MSRWLFFPTAAGGGSDWTDYMSANPGIGYWIIPAGTGGTSATSGPTGGDTSVTWYEIIAGSGSASGTTQSGTVIPVPAGEWKRGVHDGYLAYSNPYNYCAISWGTSAGTYTQANTPGWVICEREQTAGTSQGSRQSFIPIEGTDGMTSATYAGGMPGWSGATYDDSMIFFFNTYTSGDVQNWTDWDGTTTP